MGKGYVNRVLGNNQNRFGGRGGTSLAVLVAIFALSLVLGTPEADAQQIRLVAGTINTTTAPEASQDVLKSGAPGEPASGMLLVQFTGPVLPEWLENCRDVGATVHHYVPDNAFMMTVTAEQLNAIEGLPGVSWVGNLPPALKIHPMVTNAVANKSETLKLTVLGVSEAAATELKALDVEVTSARDTIMGWHDVQVTANTDALPEIAQINSVFHIELQPEVELFGERGAQTAAGQYTPGADAPTGPGYSTFLSTNNVTGGTGIVVQIQDTGLDQADASGVPGTAHPDLLGRIAGTFNATSDPSAADGYGHGTLVAGVVAGDASVGTIDIDSYLLGQGMAPLAQLYGTKIFRDTGGHDIGSYTYTDLAKDAQDAGVIISNNSWGASVGGAYTSNSAEFDALTRDADPVEAGNQPIIYFFSAGNSGSFAQSLGAPATAKNVIAVGAGENSDGDSSNSDSMMDLAYFSSRGPAADGRIGVSVFAVGTNVYGPASTAPNYSGGYYPGGQTDYTRADGTSFSGPMTAGAGVVIYEFFNTELVPLGHAGNPSPAMMKAVLTNTATDMAGGDDGAGGSLAAIPNGNQGWGSVNLETLFSMKNSLYSLDEAVVFTGSGQSWQTPIYPIDPGKPLKITLVWSDAPAAPFANPTLVNDLDLVVTGGSTYLGNVFSGGLSTTGGSADRLNNIESVFIDSPSGAYIVDINAYNIAGDGVPNVGGTLDQDFALFVWNGTNQSSAGVAQFNVASVNCSDTLDILVSDTDLQGDGTLNVTVTSTSSDSETVALTETGASTGVFTASIDTESGVITAEDGTVQVFHGGTVTVTYNDADDGTGSPAVATDDVTVDCVPPVISTVATANVEAMTAEVTFDTDEPGTSLILFGTDCGSLTRTATGGIATSHVVPLTSLLPETTYYFWVQAWDSAGNFVLDNNGGSCFSFTTPPQPDFFTEEFVSGADVFDLSNSTLTFTPNASNDFYGLSVTDNVTSFPTDPGTGTGLSLFDDDFATVPLTGGEMFPLYGTDYDTVYIGSNGYVTFIDGDYDYSPTLSDHFGRPRISIYYDDFYPRDASQVRYEQFADRFVVTYENVRTYGTSQYLSAQAALYFDGTISITYLRAPQAFSSTAIVGLSEGTGLPTGFLESELRLTLDSDGDGMPDVWETANGLDPNDSSGDNGAYGDFDGDGLANIDELDMGTDPDNTDSDGDTLTDGGERDYTYGYLIDPGNADTDFDGFDDGTEIGVGSDPTDPFSTAPAGVRYIDLTATGADNGSSWANAYPTIADALAAHIPGNEYWVADGTYAEAVTMPSDIQLYGGFEGLGGAEEFLREQRDPDANPTIIDVTSINPTGTLASPMALDGMAIFGGGSDEASPTIGLTDEEIWGLTAAAQPNAADGPVVVSISSKSNIVLDGFTVTGGSRASSGAGGGMYIYNADDTVRIVDCTITGNSASTGGGMYIYSGNPVIENCRITSNTATSGGGIRLIATSATLDEVTVGDNTATSYGGGILASLTTSPGAIIRDSFIQKNSATGSDDTWGGGLFASYGTLSVVGTIIASNSAEIGGGVYFEGSPTVTLDTVLIGENEALGTGTGDNTVSSGAGMAQLASAEPATPPTVTVLNSAIAGNYTDYRGGGVTYGGGNQVFKNTFIMGNHAEIWGGGIRSSKTGGMADTDANIIPPILINCALSRNQSSNGAAIVAYYGRPVLENTIITGNTGDNGVAIYEGDAEADFIMYNCLLDGNYASGTPYRDHDTSSDTTPDGATNPAPAPTGTVYSAFSYYTSSGTWTSNGVYDATTNTTTITDSGASFTPDEFAGTLMNTDTSQPRQSYILTNSATTVTVAGMAPWSGSGDTYQFLDAHITAASPAYDAGTTSGYVSGLLPAEDFEGDARVTGSTIDIGPDEFADNDNDGIPDYLDPDDDNDGLTDEEEENIYFTNPFVADTDGDGCNDFDEVTMGGDPNDPYHYPKVFVDLNAPGPHDGTSWATAFTTIQDGINAAAGGRVWVADGIYEETISLVSTAFKQYNPFDGTTGGVYGGFTGYGELEEDFFPQIEPTENITVIDASTADGGGPADHAVVIDTVTDLTLMGFVITGGVADGGGIDSDGGGIYMANADSTNRLRLLAFVDNMASGLGGAISLSNASPSIDNVRFAGNVADEGGGIFASGGKPMVSQAFFGGNSASFGGAIGLHDASHIYIEHSVFASNTATSGGGAIHVFGSDAGVAFSTFVDNASPLNGGGAICLWDTSLSSLAGNIFVNNAGVAIAEQNSTSDQFAGTFADNVFFNNPDGDYRDEGTTTYTGEVDIETNVVPESAGGILDTDPLFVQDLFGNKSGTWTSAPVYDPVSNLTTLTDANADFSPYYLIAEGIRPTANPDFILLVIEQTDTSVRVYGDWTGSISQGDSYSTIEVGLQLDSPAIDAAFDLADISTLLTAFSFTNPYPPLYPQYLDYSGRYRPIDIFGVGNSAPYDADIGAIEELDNDFDLLSYSEERLYGTSDFNLDSDFDDLLDGDEIDLFGTDPTNPDTDGDGATDGTEVNRGTDPLNPLDFPIIHVDHTATGANDGTSWADAYTTVAAGVSDAASSGVAVWVADGTYQESLFLSSGVKLYGGFEGLGGAEETALSEQDPLANPTIIDANGSFGVIANSVSNVRVDGFTIQNAAYDGSQILGTAIEAYGSSNVHVAQCRVLDATDASQSLATVGFVFCTDVTIEDVTVMDSDALIGGIAFSDVAGISADTIAALNNTGDIVGGIYFYNASGTVTDGKVLGNAGDRGGIYDEFNSSLTIRNSVIAGNTGTTSAGGIYLSNTQSTYENTAIAYNSGVTGGGIYDSGSGAQIHNCVIHANLATGDGGAVYATNSSFSAYANNIISSNTAQGGTLSAFYEAAAFADPLLTFNLFHNNSGGDYFDDDTFTQYTGGAAINAGVSEASENIDGDPLYVMDGPLGTSGTWLGDGYNAGANETAFTNTVATLVSDAFIGRLLVPDTSGSSSRTVLCVVDNNTQQFFVEGDRTSAAAPGDPYIFLDFHVRDGSPALDLGTIGIAPADDFEGDSRPEDIPGSGRDSTGDEVDMGVDEYIDSDLDGLSDYEELMLTTTNPFSAHSDSDGLSDGDEVNIYGTDPNEDDSDGDGFTDGEEVSQGTDPNDDQDFPSTPQPMATVYVDFVFEGAELGTETNPRNTVAEGLEQVTAGGTVIIETNGGTATSSETGRLTEPARLDVTGGGVARIGETPQP